MKKKKAIKVLEGLKNEISGDEPRVEDGYARRFRESIKLIFGSDSDYYISAKEINFLFAHPDLSKRPLSQNDSSSSCGIARDLLLNGIMHVKEFGIFKPPKKNYFEGLTNWKILTILSGLISFGFIAGWGLGSAINLFSLLLYENKQPEHNEKYKVEQYESTQPDKQPLRSK